MRHFALAALVFASCATQASKPTPLDQRLTLSVQKGSLPDVLDLIARSANVQVLYDARVTGTVTMSVNDCPAGEVLDSVAKTFGLIVVREPSGVVRVCTP